MMPPTSDSLGPYPFSLSEHLVVSDQSPSEVNNRTQTSQELLTLENEDDNTQASSRSRRTISLQESHLGAVVYAANSPHSPNSAGLPISVSVEVQGPRKRRLQEHANHPHENVSQVEKRARLSTTSCGDSLHAFESTNHENGSNKSPSSDSLAQIHSQSLPRSLEISQQTIVFWRNLFKRALHQYDETPGNDSPAPSKQPMRLPKPLLRLPSACPYHMWRQIGCTSCFTPNRCNPTDRAEIKSILESRLFRRHDHLSRHHGPFLRCQTCWPSFTRPEGRAERTFPPANRWEHMADLAAPKEALTAESLVVATVASSSREDGQVGLSSSTGSSWAIPVTGPPPPDNDHGSASLAMSSTSSETHFSTTQLSCPDFLTVDNERLRWSNQQLLSERDSMRAERDTLRQRVEGWVGPIEKLLGGVLDQLDTPSEVRAKLCELSQAVQDLRKELG